MTTKPQQIDSHTRPAQPPLSNEFKRLRDHAEAELLAPNAKPDGVTYRIMRNGTRLRFRRFGTSYVCGHHIVYED
jgi:hypothetical protein